MQLKLFCVKPLSQQSLATYRLFYQETTIENKGTQIASMKCGSLKSGIDKKTNSWRGCLSRGSVSHKGTPTSTLLKHSLRVSLLGNQVSSADSTTVTLIPGSTKELLHKGWGSTRPPHKVVVAAPHKVGGSMTLPVSHQAPKGRRTKISSWFNKEPQHKGSRPCFLTH